MRVFVINLDKDKDRMAQVASRLNTLGVSFERFPAVYAKAMDKNERKPHVNRFRWWCANGRKMLDGELGCSLSHLGVYRKMLTDNIDMACVLEDDVVIDDRFPMVLSRLVSSYNPEKNHVVLLSNHMEPPEGQIGDPFAGYLTERGRDSFHIEHCGWDTFAEGYVIGTVAAKAILAQNYPVISPADAWCRWQDNHAIIVFRAFPTVCCQNKYHFKSNMLSEAFKVSDLPKFKRWAYSVCRIIGLSIDNFLRRRTGR